jgi:hypothetical protein
MKAKNNGSQVHFWCPGCNDVHGIDPHIWFWNNDQDKPTFSPSVLVFPHEASDVAGNLIQTPRCHSFVTDGKIEFLNDCEHLLARKIVDLPDWPFTFSGEEETINET